MRQRPFDCARYRLLIVLVAIAGVNGFARSQESASILPAQPVPVTAQPVPVTALPSTPNVAKPIDPPTGGCPAISGDGGSQFGIDLLLGQFTGFRGQAAVSRTAEGAFVVEAFYGAILDKLGSGEGAGAGARYYFHRTDRAGNNSVLIGPGLGAYYHMHDGVWMAAPTVDFAWVHAIGDNGSFELGLNAGLGIGLSDRRRYYYESNAAGRITPLFSLFTGFRF